MQIAAVIEAANAIAIAIGLMGLSGCIFTALSWRRNDTTAAIQQQSTIVHDIQALNGELRSALEECRERAGSR